jgi:hypothetical protein
MIITNQQTSPLFLVPIIGFLLAGLMQFLSKKSALFLLLASFLAIAATLIDIGDNQVRLKALVNDFQAGRELICEEEGTNRTLRITNKTYQLREDRLAFQGAYGFDILNQNCRSITFNALKSDFITWFLYGLAIVACLISLLIDVALVTVKKSSKKE